MNKKILIGVVVVLLIGGGLFMMNKGDDAMGRLDAMMEKSDDESSGLGTISGGLKELFAKGKSMQCDFEHTAETGVTSGTVYISGNDMRGDFELVQQDGKTVTSNMIRKGDTSYVWSSEFDQGFKTVIPEVTNEADNNYDQTAMQSDPFAELENQNVTYDCKPWIVNATMFTPPSDIEFVDYSAQMQKMQRDEDSVKSLQCSACDQAPDATSKEQCRKALGCN